MHIRKKRLVAWLNGATDEKAEIHVGGCPRCLNRVDAILDNHLGIHLTHYQEWLEADEHLQSRIVKATTGRIEPDGVMGLVGGLFAAGLETSKILVGE